MTVYLVALSLLFGLSAGVVAFFVTRSVRERNLVRSLALTLLLVRIPRSKPKDGDRKEFQSEIAQFERLLSNLGSLKSPVVFEMAVPHVGEEIHFYLAVPKAMAEVAMKQIQGIWNGASLESTLDDYNIFNANGVTAAAYLSSKDDFSLPIRTYEELEDDPMSSVLGGLAKVNEIGEGAAIQVILRPAPESSKKAVLGRIEALRKGQPLEKVFGHGLNWKEVSEVLNPQTEDKNERSLPVDEEAVKALEKKAAKPMFLVNVRVLASAATPFQAKDILDGILAGFEQFGSPRRNGFRAVRARNPQGLASQFIFRRFESGQTMVLSSEEVASFCHFPTSGTETPRVKWLKSREAPPPSNLPAKGALIGRSVFRGETRPVFITDEDRRRHVYLVGQTGTGKSTLLGNMVIEDIKAGKGLAVIDPHGTLVDLILGHIPKERMEDLIYFDPGDLWRPMGLNMLDYNLNRPEEKTFIVNEMQSIFNKLFVAETMGPMFEQYMRNALLLLMEDMPNEPATLVEVPRIFTDPEYRKRKLARIKNPVVIDFWEKEAVKAGGEASLANMTPYITSKFNNFVANDYMRPIIGQPKSAFNFRGVMDDGKILLVNLAKGRIGDINAGLLGMIFTGKILMAALSRVDIPEESKRRDFNLYIDEFQNFTTASIASILSEARKYRLSLTIAHQFIAQLEENIRDSVFGNVGSEIVFRVGPQDAEFLKKQFDPVFDENDLMNIDNMNAYAKILINGETSRPFNLRIETTSWSKGDPDSALKLKEYSRVKFGLDRDLVEEGIYKRLRE